MALLACPFCRQLFPAAEARTCPECGVALVAMDKLPLSLDAQAEELEGERMHPDDVPVPWLELRSGRLALVALALLGLWAFFQPWVEMSRPETVSISGYHLARSRAGWLWGGAIAWFLLLPLVLSRRTPYQMRGVRIVTATFAAMTLLEVAMLLGFPPESRGYRVDFEWGFGLYVSGIVSLLAVAIATRFGGPRAPLTPARATSSKTRSDRILH